MRTICIHFKWLLKWPFQNHVYYGKLLAEKEAKEAELEEKMDRWMYLSELAEKIAAQ